MDEQTLSYSTDALDTLTLFHEMEFVIFVEGDDDEGFWLRVFELAGFTRFTVKIAGGSEEIDKYTDSIISGGADIIVARDSDYLGILSKRIDHPRVIYTYGYSIENTLFHPAIISRVLATYCHTLSIYEAEIEAEMDQFFRHFICLIVYDIANRSAMSGNSVLGRTCHIYLRRDSSLDAKVDYIENKCQQLQKSISKDQFNEAFAIMQSSGHSLRSIINGHILTHVAIIIFKSIFRRVKHKAIVISPDNLYAHSTELLPNFVQIDHIEFLLNQIKRLATV
jgi:subtilase family serine protease